MLGFVLSATIIGTQKSTRQTNCALTVAIGVRRQRPAAIASISSIVGGCSARGTHFRRAALARSRQIDAPTYVKGQLFPVGGQLGQDRDEPLDEGKLLLGQGSGRSTAMVDSSSGPADRSESNQVGASRISGQVRCWE